MTDRSVPQMGGHREVLSLQVSGVPTEIVGMHAYIERHTLNWLLREGDLVNQSTEWNS